MMTIRRQVMIAMISSFISWFGSWLPFVSASGLHSFFSLFCFAFSTPGLLLLPPWSCSARSYWRIVMRDIAAVYLMGRVLNATLRYFVQLYVIVPGTLSLFLELHSNLQILYLGTALRLPHGTVDGRDITVLIGVKDSIKRTSVAAL